ncbi:hypothetical protein HPB49_004896 [Dermacentor silvarum]|uniref:Uncharacterized protein n=1 Tax=Dermacentor silvarum TaxID=543639 RepID=A0ACB8C260_DERSI|nr:hypothetical protein HPB49_004896 [Dermacentor silvarum]
MLREPGKSISSKGAFRAKAREETQRLIGLFPIEQRSQDHGTIPEAAVSSDELDVLVAGNEVNAVTEESGFPALEPGADFEGQDGSDKDCSDSAERAVVPVVNGNSDKREEALVSPFSEAVSKAKADFEGQREVLHAIDGSNGARPPEDRLNDELTCSNIKSGYALLERQRRVQGVSFHEIPSDSSLRDQWLKAISRKDWGPASNPVVCSLHFLTADFRKDCKKRLLKAGAVPSVFDEQESCAAHAEATEAAKQGDERARKRKRECSPSASLPDTLFTCASETECVVTVADIADRRAIAEHPPGANTHNQSPEQPPYSEDLLRRSSPLPLGQQDQSSACGTQVDVVPGKPEPNENRNEATSEELARFRGGQRRRKVCAKRSWQTQTPAIPSSSTLFIERKRWRERERSLKAKNDRLRKTIDAYKQELEKLKEECHVRTFHEVASDAEKGILKARILLDQVKNYSRKKPLWSETTIRHCIVLHNLSAKAYEYLRSEELLRLPCRKTLRKYIGSVSGEVCFAQPVRCRLETELQALCTPQSKVRSLIVDEIRIRQKLEYHKQRDAFVGDVDMGSELEHLTPNSETETLANSVLCFLLCGLHVTYKIPVDTSSRRGSQESSSKR